MFTEFWSLYPKKVAKKEAQKAWGKLSEAEQLQAIAALPNHCRRWNEYQYIPHPATWLNGARWEDEINIVPNKADEKKEWLNRLTGKSANGTIIDMAAKRIT